MLWIWKHHLFSAWIIHSLWGHPQHGKWPATSMTNSCRFEQETLFSNAFPLHEHLIRWSHICSCNSDPVTGGQQARTASHINRVYFPHNITKHYSQWGLKCYWVETIHLLGAAWSSERRSWLWTFEKLVHRDAGWRSGTFAVPSPPPPPWPPLIPTWSHLTSQLSFSPIK